MRLRTASRCLGTIISSLENPKFVVAQILPSFILPKEIHSITTRRYSSKHTTFSHNPPGHPDLDTHSPFNTRYVFPITRTHPPTQAGSERACVLPWYPHPDTPFRDLEHVDGYRCACDTEVGPQ